MKEKRNNEKKDVYVVTNVILAILSVIVWVLAIVFAIPKASNNSAPVTRLGQGTTIIEETKNTVKETVDDLDDMVVEAFNDKFEVYFGDNVSGMNVKALISKIASSNLDSDNEEITIIINGSTVTDSTAQSKIVLNKKYKVYAKEKTGYIKTICIDEV